MYVSCAVQYCRFFTVELVAAPARVRRHQCGDNPPALTEGAIESPGVRIYDLFSILYFWCLVLDSRVLIFRVRALYVLV